MSSPPVGMLQWKSVKLQAAVLRLQSVFLLMLSKHRLRSLCLYWFIKCYRSHIHTWRSVFCSFFFLNKGLSPCLECIDNIIQMWISHKSLQQIIPGQNYSASEQHLMKEFDGNVPFHKIKRILSAILTLHAANNKGCNRIKPSWLQRWMMVSFATLHWYLIEHNTWTSNAKLFL